MCSPSVGQWNMNNKVLHVIFFVSSTLLLSNHTKIMFFDKDSSFMCTCNVVGVTLLLISTIVTDSQM